LSRLAQVDMQVDESRGDDQAARVESFVGAAADFICRRDFSHAAVT